MGAPDPTAAARYAQMVKQGPTAAPPTVIVGGEMTPGGGTIVQGGMPEGQWVQPAAGNLRLYSPERGAEGYRPEEEGLTPFHWP